MDNNNFKQKNKLFIRFCPLLILILLLMVSFTTFRVYQINKTNKYSHEENVENFIEDRSFYHLLNKINGFVRYNKKGEKYDFYMYDEYKYIKNVKYLFNNKDTKKRYTNISDYTYEKLQKLSSKNMFLLQLNINKNGKIDVMYNSSKIHSKEWILDNIDLDIDTIKDFANYEITYIVPEKLSDVKDLFMISMQEMAVKQYSIMFSYILVLSLIVISILGFMLPYEVQKQNPINKLYCKMFLELKIIFTFGIIASIIALMIELPNILMHNSIDIMDMIYYSYSEIYLFVIPLLFLIYIIEYINVVYIKYIYNNGFINGLVKNSLIGKIFIWCLKNGINFIKILFRISTDKFSRSNFIKIFIINLVVLFIIFTGGILGFLVAIIYTLYIIKKTSVIIDRVRYLNEQSDKLSKGKLDIDIDENIGMLSIVSKNLNNIKEGFKIALDKKTKSERMKAELITNVSHDLKTPLTSIITYVDLLKKNDINEDEKVKYIDILDKKSKRLKILIDDLFEVTKLNSGNVEMNIEEVNVIALFRQTFGELEEKIKKSTLDFRVNIPNEEIVCDLDGVRTYRVFSNIISNILKYSLDSTRVYIDLKENDEKVKFIFKNIASYEMNFDEDEITERFTRGDKSRSIEGSGLGLAIAKSLVEKQKGIFKIQTDGDLFKVTIIFDKV